MMAQRGSSSRRTLVVCRRRQVVAYTVEKMGCANDRVFPTVFVALQYLSAVSTKSFQSVEERVADCRCLMGSACKSG
jgi:hypothetical protein